jgi:hypothetical protein
MPMSHLLDFTGKMSKIDLVALHEFGECGKRTYASIHHLERAENTYNKWASGLN